MDLMNFGWRGSVFHWSRYETAYLLIAALATPLVVSVHSVVSLDFQDHPFSRYRQDAPCALCGANDSYLDEIVTDDKGGRMFVCSDTDYCERRRADGHRGTESAIGPSQGSGQGASHG